MGKVTNQKTIKSDFFTLEEFTRSTTAKRLKINNAPNDDIIRNIQYGVQMVLDPLRRILQSPIIITSGYRCAELNKAVGGVVNSWHTKGNAADIRVKNEEEAKAIFQVLKTLPSVDTVLFEHSATSIWMHIQWDMEKTPRHHFNFNYVVK
jgi:zinc D-Ala-D-Ala carboxypeptidase